MARHKRAVRRLRNNAGVTLIEIMFAASILAFSFSVIFGSLTSMYVLGRINEDRVLAVAAVSSLLEDLQGRSFSELASYRPPAIDAPGKEHWVTAEVLVPATSDEDRAAGRDVKPLSLPASTTDRASIPNPAEVRITLYWVDVSGREYKFRASTVRHN